MKGQKTGGRSRGVPNRRTEQKRMLDELMREHGPEYVAGILKDLQQTPRGTQKGLDMLRELAVMAKNCVAIYQPKHHAGGALPVIEQPERLQNFLSIAVKAAAELTRYESPTFKAIAIQEVPPAPAALPGDGAKVVGSMGKRSQQDAANVYLRLIRNDPKAA